MKIKFNNPFLLFLSISVLSLLLLAQSCKKSEADLPTISLVQSVTTAEGDMGQTAVSVEISLTSASDNTVTVLLSTEEGTAKSEVDFVAFANTEVIFNPGETSKSIAVNVIGNTEHEENKTFYVNITNVQQAALGNSKTEIIIENDDQFIPEVYFDSITKKNEGDAATTQAAINFRLTGIAQNPVIITYRTYAISATPGVDYTEVENETLTISAGDFEKKIYLTILGDTNFELDDVCGIEFVAVEGAVMEHQSAVVKIINDDTYTPQLLADGYITPMEYPDMQLVWSDEFEGSSVDGNNWTFETGGGGWGNNELQVYTNSTQNAFVSNGKLNIVATSNYGNYSSARMISKGKQEFVYGRIDIRAKITYGKGIWPALWMLGSNISSIGWPRCGEIDIMENVGHEPKLVHGTIHYNDGGHQYTGESYQLPTNQNFYEQFHVFSIVWQDDGIRWFVDYVPYYYVSSTSIEYEAFQLPQFFIMNVAVGGNWPGNPDATTVFPQTMQVDYVRVFK